MQYGAINNDEMVVFLNKPRLVGHEANRIFDERRQELASQMKDFIGSHPLFVGKRVEVIFAQSGISSLVSTIDTGTEKYVLKIPLRYSGNEVSFLKAWENAGVKVPHVIEVGEMNGNPYILMEHINALQLREAYSVEELLEKGLYVEMGAVLRKMHSVTAIGYGDLMNGNAEFPNIKTWLESSLVQGKFLYTKEHGLLNAQEHGSLEEALEVLYSNIGSDPRTVYGHGDFSIGNVFATSPLTVFDPIPFLNHPYMDLGRTLVLEARRASIEPGKQILKGYFGDEEYDVELLRASVITNAYTKLRFWHETKRFEDVKKLQDYLTQLSFALRI